MELLKALKEPGCQRRPISGLRVALRPEDKLMRPVLHYRNTRAGCLWLPPSWYYTKWDAWMKDMAVHPCFLRQLWGLLKGYYGYLQCWNIQNETSKNDKTLCQRWLHWNSWHNVFVYKGGNILKGANSLVFLCGLDVLWLSRSNCFSYPVRWEGRQHPLCSFDTGPVSLSLPQYSVLCRRTDKCTFDAIWKKTSKWFIPTNKMEGSPSSIKNCHTHSSWTIFYTFDLFFFYFWNYVYI